MWFYQKEGKKEGPVTREEIARLLGSGELGEDALVFEESLGEWTRIGQLEHFHFLALDSAPTVPMEKKLDYERETDFDEASPRGKTRPWARYFARMLDYSFFFLALHLVLSGLWLGGVNPGLLRLLSLFAFYLLLFLWVWVEACLLSTWGTTPGKWVFRMAVRMQAGRKLPFLEAINRSLSVWWLGMGAGIPIVSLITMITAAIRLSRRGVTSWDERGHYCIEQQTFSFFSIVVAIIVAAVLLFLTSLTLKSVALKGIWAS